MRRKPKRSQPVVLALACLLPLLLGSTAGADENNLEQRKQELLLKLKIHRAIDRGAHWLAGCQESNGSFKLDGQGAQGPSPMSRHRFGESALATLTLAHCGYDAGDKEIKKAVQYLRKRWRSLLKGDFFPQAASYSLALTVLALHEIYASPPEERSAEDRKRYGLAPRRASNPCGYPTWARAIVWKILDWMIEHRVEEGLFRYPGDLPGGRGGGGRGGGGKGGGGPGGAAGAARAGRPGGPDASDRGMEDLSNSQYVLLALWTGTRCGYEIDLATLEHIARRLIEWQEANGRSVQRVLDPVDASDGEAERYGPMNRPKGVTDRARGFGYTPGARPTGSMTTAGLSSLAIVKAMIVEQHELDVDLRRDLDQGMWDAIAWLTVNFTVNGNPMPRGPGPVVPSPTWHYYYLYGLERAGVIAGKRTLGDQDWYKAGARLLVDAQKEGGRWQPPSAIGGMGPMSGGAAYDTSMLDTCFALLFLKRATMQPQRPTLPPPVTTPNEE